MDQRIIVQLEAIVGKPDVVTNKEQMQNYLFDESPASVRPTPANDLVLVRPADAQQISAILTLANEHRIALFPRGGGTGLVGGAVPSIDGIILSMERMNKIEIDMGNVMAVAEAGVTLERLAKAADEVSLSFPPHPGDESAQVGGMVATNAGGSRAVRHGVMRNQVRAIEVVLPTGEILNLGRKVHKNNVGYDLMQLIIGSEGTLAVITRATLQLYPKYGATATLENAEQCDCCRTMITLITTVTLISLRRYHAISFGASPLSLVNRANQSLRHAESISDTSRKSIYFHSLRITEWSD